jgi:DNA polymerase III subunit beta
MTVTMPVDEERQFLIPLGILKTILKSRPRSISIAQEKDEKLRISYDDKAVIFARQDPNDFPKSPEGDFNLVGTWTSDVINKLHSQVPFCSADEQRPALCGVFVSQNGVLSSCATDGHVLRLIKNIDEAGACSLTAEFNGIIPKKVLQLLPRFVDETVTVSESEDSMRFSLSHGIELTARKIIGTFPNYLRVIPDEFQGIVQLDKEKLNRLMIAAKDFCDKETRKSVFKAVGKNLVIAVENLDDEMRWESRLPFETMSGKRLEMGLNLDHLERILKGIETPKTSWKYNDSDSASLFIEVNGKENDNLINLIMPIRLPKEMKDG